MNIEHIAIWVFDIERMRTFYERYFDAEVGKKYMNSKNKLTSYFLSFEEGARLELMHKPEISSAVNQGKELMGFTHFAISIGSKTKVDTLTNQLREGEFNIAREPRITGDGYYESVVLNHGGNRIEITI